jgi:hypothetical protein
VTGSAKSQLSIRRPRDALAALLFALLAFISLPVRAYLWWRRHLLIIEVRRAWGDRPHVIVRLEGPMWTTVLRERWLPSATERTLVLDSVPDPYPGRRALPIEWRVYLEWGPDYTLVRPPVALIVCKSGKVKRVDFEQAMQALAIGNDAPLQERLEELLRLSHHP